jgi:hypothetical protein
MADHYYTAYMADVFDRSLGGSGARLSAAVADGNYSVTAALLPAAPVFLKLSKEGTLERDICLVHLTGEEFLSDCMGARNFCQNVVQRTLKMRGMGDRWKDLSQASPSRRLQGWPHLRGWHGQGSGFQGQRVFAHSAQAVSFQGM